METPRKTVREVRAEKIVKAVQLWLQLDGKSLAALKKAILEILP